MKKMHFFFEARTSTLEYNDLGNILNAAFLWFLRLHLLRHKQKLQKERENMFSRS
jgi:hypothetical protein